MSSLRSALFHQMWVLLLAMISVGCGHVLIGDDDYHSAGGVGGAATTGGGGVGGAATTGGGGSGGAPCDPAKCPPAGSECVDVVCTPDGSCGEAPKPDGTKTPTQTAGDCLETVCQAGVPINMVDDADVPDDGNECTNDMCNNGVAVIIPKPVNSACGAGGALHCNAVGGCVGCNDASQCGAPAGECQMATCMAGACGTANKQDGMSCSDNDACTVADTCQAGACASGAPMTCAWGEACTAGSCIGDPIAYLKASNTGAGDAFGWSLALSADGNTLAVAANWEDSNATGINSNQADNSATDSGAVYVFTHSGATWVQQAYVKASNAGAGDWFGVSVALSADGNTLAVGAHAEDSNAAGINGNQADNSAADSGAVYVFTRSGGVWSQQAYVKASNAEAYDYFGWSVALSADGNTLGVGAQGEDSNATGIGGIQADNSATDSGAVYVFTRSGATWSQQAYVKASNAEAYDSFGNSVALSADGNTLAVAAYWEDSNANGINGIQSSNSATDSGAVYVFSRGGAAWSQQAYVKASNTDAADRFGWIVALSADGNILAVGAYLEDSNATGINGIQSSNSATDSGAAYVFTRSGGVWSQQAYVKASNTDAADRFGVSVALSADGSILAVGAYREDSNATGIGGIQSSNSATDSGAVYVFTRSGAAWSQQAYVKASNTEAGDFFGNSVALSTDGTTMAVGACLEDSNATGINGDQTDKSAADSGAVYIY